MATSLVQDAAFPAGASLQPGAVVSAGYIGGDALHVWSTADWAQWATQYRVPIWVRSNPGSVDATTDAAACLNALTALGAPAPYLVAVYGSTSTLFSNPAGDGYWVADPTGAQHMYNHANVIATQYLFAGTYDLSEIDQSVPTWDVSTGTGPTLVLLDIEQAVDAAYVNTFVSILHGVAKMDTGMIVTTVNGLFVAAAANSSDGINWTAAENFSTPPQPPAGSVDTGIVVTTLNGGNFAAAEANSSDGQTWTLYTQFAQ